MERHIIDRFIDRQRVARDITATPVSLGDRLADRVASFGGNRTFIFIAVAPIAVWMLINALLNKGFDPIRTSCSIWYSRALRHCKRRLS